MEPIAKKFPVTGFSIVTRPDWTLKCDSLSARYEIINDSIFHSISTGNLEENHVPKIFEKYEQIILSNRLPQKGYYLIIGMAEVGSSSRKARSLYFEHIKNWYKRYPFKMYISYGANRYLRAAINMAGPFMPFPVRMVKDFKVELINPATSLGCCLLDVRYLYYDAVLSHINLGSKLMAANMVTTTAVTKQGAASPALISKTAPSLTKATRMEMTNISSIDQRPIPSTIL